MFDNLDYANWKRFPIGTMVKRKSVTSSEIEFRDGHQRGDAHAAQGRPTARSRSRARTRPSGATGRSSPSTRPMPGRSRGSSRIPKGMTAEDFSKPSQSAKPAGEEVLTVLGKEYKTTSTPGPIRPRPARMEVRVWLSERHAAAGSSSR